MPVNLIGLLLCARLGDKRLNERAAKIVESMVQGHMSATNGTQGTGHAQPFAHCLGSFRFYDNERLTLPALYAPCLAALAQQVPSGERCYVVHDFSPLDYSQHQAKEDLIQVGNERGYGYDCYTALVLDAKGNALGPVMQQVRTSKGCLSSDNDRIVPFVDHLSQIEHGVKLAQRVLPGRLRVHLIDREGDDLQLHRFYRDEKEKSIIRCQHLKRKVEVAGQLTTLQTEVERLALSPAGQVTREGKTYDLFIGEMTDVVFSSKSLRGVARKRNKPKVGPPICVRVVVAELRQQGRAAYRWVLLTDLDDPILNIVQAYVWRWRIERFFYLNKVGFRLEQWRQESGERIVRRLALTQLAAMIIYQLQHAADSDSDPQLTELVKVIATLGGWLGRKGDRIGPIILMRGMALVLGMVRALEEFGPARLLDIAHQLTSHLGLPHEIPLIPPAPG